MLIRPADPTRDNAALCALARRCPQGRRFRFYHRRDDYWVRCRRQLDAQVSVIEDGGILAATATLARKRLWFDGAWHPATYLFDLMVAPEFRGRGLARQLLEEMRRAAPAGLTYSYIVEDNTASRRLFESVGYTAHPRRLLFHLLSPRLAGRRSAGVRLGPADDPTAAELDVRLPLRYDFFDPVGGHDGVFRLDRGKTRAWVALRRHEPQVLVSVPWPAAVLGRLLPVVPGPGRPVLAWSLHHLAADGPGAAGAVERLVRAVAWAALRERIDAVAVPLFEGDPRAGDVRGCTLTGWGLPPVANRLYVAGELSRLALSSQRPFLMSSRDA